MSCDKSAAEFLLARDRRQEALALAMRKGSGTTLFLSLNMPGPDKSPPGTAALFAWALREIKLAFPGLEMCVGDGDALGPWAIASIASQPARAKIACIALEECSAATRLLDLDVYSGAGQQVDRASLALPPRRCLLCSHPAVECIRSKRHTYPEVIAKAHELLARFRT